MDAAQPGPHAAADARADRARRSARWARRADRVITVNRPYAEVMADALRVDAAARS